MIYRKNYRACILDDSDLENILKQDKLVVEEAIKSQRCLTVAIYRHENMLFLYMEALEEELTPIELFPELSKLLALWPEREGMTPWAYMYPIYYHAIPESIDEWKRNEKKIRRGRIAYLKEDKMFSYVYHHKAIVDEGLLEGDRYQFIALHEDILFSYFEEPKQFTHINLQCNEPSRAIEEWIKADPESHFDHELSGEENFLLLPMVFSMGLEDL
ncbi:MAG: hypothetical protein E7290_09595 [Lachnospiraceae bacterium]|nr:hypothetical protein [Lachnospiraceae bacterium]